VTIAVINSGGANLSSVQHALHRLGVDSVLTKDAAVIRAADRVILPGVGAAARAMNALREAMLVEVVQGLTQPVLGICLGLIPGRVRKLKAGTGLRLPHMGWNRLEWVSDDPLTRGLGGEEWFYFVHGFAAPVKHAVAVSEHGQRFAAIVRRGNFVACQFHPEKSAGAGARILRNFLDS